MSLRWKYLFVVLGAFTVTVMLRLFAQRAGWGIPPMLSALTTVGVLTLGLMISYRVFVARPLALIVDGAQRLADGDLAHRIKVDGRSDVESSGVEGDEMDTIARAINYLADRAAHSRTQLEREVAERTSDLRAVLEEVHERSRIVEEVNQRLAELDRRRTEFLSNVSHELRTPLNSMLGFLRLLLDGMAESDEERHEFLANARLAGTHMKSLVESVLTSTQIAAGTLKIEPTRFHPADTMRDVLIIMKPQAREKDLKLRLEAAGAAIAYADEGKVRQVLLNLVGNAMKFTEQGEIVARVWVDEDTIRFEVRDTGIGIPAEELERIFLKFHQVDSPEQRCSGGTGLGLSIARDLVTRMGGEIGAASDGPGEGARFFFSVPAARPVAVETEAAQT